MFRALYPRTIWLIFLSFSAIILCLGLFWYWLPNQEEAKFNVTQANSLYDEANKLKQAVTKKNKAIQAVKDAEAAWLPTVVSRTPSEQTGSGGINVNVNPYQLLLDTKKFRNDVQRAVNKQLIYGGVKVIAGPRVPGVDDNDAPNQVMASYYNYPAIPFPVVIYDLGQVQIQGTYEQIMKNVRAWAGFPHYLAVTHNLQINGTAPLLSATYDLSVVGYIRYDGIFGPVPDLGGASSSSGSGGFGAGKAGFAAGLGAAGGRGGPSFGPSGGPGGAPRGGPSNGPTASGMSGR
ncbi:MAG: hypothetical protein GC165_03705 [Armatimonadetes bacterium]|nr:hypothetical protein [Armatimonadota bacterium]